MDFSEVIDRAPVFNRLQMRYTSQYIDAIQDDIVFRTTDLLDSFNSAGLVNIVSFVRCVISINYA